MVHGSLMRANEKDSMVNFTPKKINMISMGGYGILRVVLFLNISLT